MVTPQSWVCSYCHCQFDQPGGETFCAPCWAFVLEMREYRQDQQRIQAAIDARPIEEIQRARAAMPERHRAIFSDFWYLESVRKLRH